MEVIKASNGDKVVELNNIFDRNSDSEKAKRTVKMIEKLKLQLAEQEFQGSDWQVKHFSINSQIY